MAAFSAIALGLGAAAGVGGQIAGAAGQRKQAEAARRAAEANAREAEIAANDTLEQARELERRFTIQAEKFIGTQRATRGASGITVEGSASDVIAESAANAETQARDILARGSKEASRLRREAKNIRLTGESRARGFEAASTASLIGAAGTGLGGIASLTRKA